MAPNVVVATLLQAINKRDEIIAIDGSLDVVNAPQKLTKLLTQSDYKLRNDFCQSKDTMYETAPDNK
ncbi:hypothetical protein PsorP6_004403 [Peronosclerospora sorghi]|uniref:Uncharacterized protein n=1 Tax=Peronosclerospora sorghi TaxID=230839 RepID=A0ACC0VRA4_9STRA|nr:hypothetical protein PsorP6_004403 [Peronosclerospora sorghi]